MSEQDIPVYVGQWRLEAIRPPSSLGSVRTTAVYVRRVNSSADASIAIDAPMGSLREAIMAVLEGSDE